MSGAARALVRVLLLLLTALGLISGCQNLAGEFEEVDGAGGSGPSFQGDCKPGDWRCNREFLLECLPTGKWEVRETCNTAAQCDQANKTCTVCAQAGQRRCNGAKRQVCSQNRSEWTFLQDCEAADQCSPTHCGPCTTGEVQCSGDELKDLQVCNADNRWQPVATCETASLCERSVSMSMTDMSWTPACLPPVCESGALSCDGSSLFRCRQGRDGFDRVDICSSPALCQMAAQAADATAQMCPLGCGPAGSFRCTEDKTIEQCAFDQTGWQMVDSCAEDMDCDPLTGQCGARCAPGSYRCNAGSLESCSAEQTWVVEKTCATAALCSISPPSCIEPSCRPNDRRCDPENPSVLQECNDDQSGFVSLETCLTAELCACSVRGDCSGGLTATGCGNAVCMPSMDGELPLRCNPAAPKEVQVCNATLNAWDPLATCTEEEFCYTADRADPCKTECPVSGLLCDGAELLACGLEGPMHQADCATATLCECVLSGTCTGGVGATGCGSPICGGTLATNQCSTSFLETCQVGRNGWDAVDCGTASLCYPGQAPDFVGGYCAICETAGVVECTADAMATQTCAPDRKSYVGLTACQFGCLERPGPSADYCAACAPDELRCNGSMPGSKVQQCNADQTGLVDIGMTCPSGCLDLGLEDTCAACQPNELRCDGLVLKRCNAARTGLDTVQTCSPSCIDSGLEDHCGMCVVGSTQCSGDTLQTCQSNGSWNMGMNCTNGCVVKTGDDNCAPLCRPGTYRCQAGTGTDARLEQCNANGDAWTLVTTCTTNMGGSTGAMLCDAANGRCDACVAGDYRCSSGTLQDCNPNGDWKAASGPCNGNTLRVCGMGMTGSVTPQSCTICDPTNRECDDCNPVTTPYSCASGVLRSCDGTGHWVSGANNCTGSTLRTCTGNVLNPEQTCTICDETNNECDDCSGTTFRCTGSGNMTLQSCDGTGHWANSAACPSTGSTLYTCNTGTSAPTTTPCPTGQTCNMTQTACNMCDNGQTRCFDGDTQQTCSGMMWGSNEECGAALCSNNTCNDCLPSTWKACNQAGTQLLTCGMNGSYPAMGLACENGCYGSEPNAYCGDCTPTTDKSCNAGSLVTCGANGRYPMSGGTACGANGCWEPTPGEGYCGVCVSDTLSCSGKQPQTCTMGQLSNNGPVCSGNCFNGACVACNVTADCSGGLKCKTGGHTCVECNVDADCTGGEVCDTTTNTCVGCVDDGDCGMQVCDEANDECVDCMADADCGTGEVCDMATNTCEECFDDGDCTGGEVCDEASNTCVECTANGECTNGEVCKLSDHTCVECTADAQCAPDVCDETNNTCVGCVATSDCDTDEVCDTASDTCVECLTSMDCANNAPDLVCRTTDHTCVQCLGNIDCGSGMTCGMDNTCGP